MEAIIDVSYSAKDLSVIKSLCSKNHADMLSSNSACLQLLQVLQDSNRLKMLSPKERQGIVIQVIFNPLVQIEPEKRTVTVQDILSAKSNALLKGKVWNTQRSCHLNLKLCLKHKQWLIRLYFNLSPFGLGNVIIWPSLHRPGHACMQSFWISLHLQKRYHRSAIFIWMDETS